MNKKALLEQKEITQNELNVYIRKLESGDVLTDEEFKSASLLKEKVSSLDEKIRNLNDNKGEDDNMSKRNYSDLEKELEMSIRDLKLSNNAAVVPSTISDRIVAKVHEIIDISQCQFFPIKGDVVVPVDGNALELEAITEGTEIGAADGNFTSVKLTAKPHGKIVKIGKSLLQNSQFDLLAYFENKMAMAIANTIEHKIVDAVFGGSNTQEVAGGLKADDLVKALVTLKKIDGEGAKFIMNRDMFVKVASLKDGQGNYLVQSGIINGTLTYTLLGRAVEVSENAPANKIAVANLAGVAVKLSPEVTIESLCNYRNQWMEALLGAVEVDCAVVEQDKVVVMNIAG